MPETLSKRELVTLTAARVASALASGALRPIETERLEIADGGVRFIVRAVSSLAHREHDRGAPAAAHGDGAAKAPVDPFGPPDPELRVGDVCDTHVAVLNKYPVLERHLLIVTRRFVDQEVLLDADDFAAATRCLEATDGLVFYNGGKEAGASQSHKHLQLLPLPLVPGGPPVPVQPLLDAAAPGGSGSLRVPGFAFRHALRRPDAIAPADLLECFREAMDRTGLRALPGRHGARQSAPYNLLLTREWMLLVRRRCEGWHGIAVNALGFAGSLFVRDPAQLAAVREMGPLRLLREVSVPDGD